MTLVVNEVEMVTNGVHNQRSVLSSSPEHTRVDAETGPALTTVGSC